MTSTQAAAPPPWSPSNPWADLQGALCVITGAGGGLGRGIVRMMVDVGASVLATDVDPAALQELRSEIASDRLHTQQVDVTDAADFAACEERVRAIGLPLALWVNNAGVILRKPAEGVTDADWDRVFDINARSVLVGSQAAYRVFTQQGRGGSIVNLASVVAWKTMEGRVLYGTSKAAVVQLTRQLAVEWGRHGIRVNAIAPGIVLTPISHLWNASDDERQATIDQTPLRRLGEIDDIARGVLMLASGLTGYVTGQTLVIDGGLTLG
ncbi:SDR family NAD(P)-dependent oxidoreductase [Ruicaihuangia caeni]|uniref:SDR family oxidoreductase n=1 Tax=Ruicaihuangia caeni TaxID=3042517 RepID=A0AAW6TC91_9MICO|nr:SDR family oxidoreductase [Klugiella sp. YN-L-19]MDI2099623.1 SDR family oxidoreductase [Klugiella sp. YN-L-19]